MIGVKKRKSQRITEFGDFQTPNELAIKIVNQLRQWEISPASIIEPTCGTGSFIFASLKTFTDANVIGYDINPSYLKKLSEELVKEKLENRVEQHHVDFFKVDWHEEMNKLAEPILVLGNPPWVTSSEIGMIGGSNIPEKYNIYDFRGLDSKTGKSNFDISEWMILELLKALTGHLGTLAMLCKVSVARKVLMYAKKERITISFSKIFLIDAKEYFNASVDSCLFLCNLKPDSCNYMCQVYQNIDSTNLIQEIGYVDKKMIANLSNYKKWKYLQGISNYIWRSGIKHDCAKVMELRQKDNHYYNGFGEVVSIEEEFLYPMLKSSDLANDRIKDIDRWMIVTQKYIGEDTTSIQREAPLTWKYLELHNEFFEKRGSSVYNNRPQFSIFGVGSYSFSPWKIAISGFYKNLEFRLISPFLNKPVVFDDTCYFIPLDSYEEAIILHTILRHPITDEFYSSFIFWDAKRPITKQILRQLDLKELMLEIGYSNVLKIINENFPALNSDALSKSIRKMRN